MNPYCLINVNVRRSISGVVSRKVRFLMAVRAAPLAMSSSVEMPSSLET